MPVPAIVSWIDENWQSIECQFYGGVQAGAFNAAIGSLFTGKFPLALGLAGVSYAAGWTAEQAGCNYVEPEPDNPQLIAGCKKFSSGTGILRYNSTVDPPDGILVNALTVEVVDVRELVLGPTEKYWDVEYKYLEVIGGSPKTQTFKQRQEFTAFPVVSLTPNEGAVCGELPPEPEPPVHNPGDPIAEPINHVVGGCNWTIQATDAYVDDQMVWHTYYVISADNDACGGPFAYWSSDKGPDWVAPEPPAPPDGPDGPQPPLPPRDYNPRFDDIDDDLDKIQEELEKLKECACPEKPELAKHWRSIRFESDETTPRGNRRLSKLFRYRGVSPGVVDDVADHWKDFRWTTGPACVYHKGSPLGTPKVWASTVDEGKRVIRHAGREAGIDPDQTGEWGVSGSDNPRYGVSLEVGLYCVDGCWSATARSGPSGYPEASVVFPDS